MSEALLHALFALGGGFGALARYLLTRTSIPVKEIAYQVGIADIHAFNKLCKRYLGAAPSRVREGV